MVATACCSVVGWWAQGARRYAAKRINQTSGAPSQSNSGAFCAGHFARYMYGMCDTKPTRRCTAIAGEFLDSAMNKANDSNPSTGAKYLSEYRAGMGRVPMAWGWHAYRDGQESASITSAHASSRWRRLRSFVRATVPTNGATAPEILLLEQGPRWFNGGRDLGMIDSRAAHMIDCYTHSAIHASTRINGFFYYLITGRADFDTGLRDFRTGNARPLSVAAFQGHSDPNRSC
jgi:hypothetical protein